MIPRPACQYCLGTCQRRRFLGPYSDLLDLKSWGWGPASWDGESPPGDSGAGEAENYGRTTILANVETEFWGGEFRKLSIKARGSFLVVGRGAWGEEGLGKGKVRREKKSRWVLWGRVA